MITVVRAHTFVDDKEHKFKLSTGVVATVLGYRQDDPSRPEAGGILLGRYILDCDDVVVDEATVPVEDDRRSRQRFYRSAKHHQDAICRAWARSAGTCNYLGEWHTHPEADPSPSSIDLAGWRRKLIVDHVDSGVLYFVIVGTHAINVWCGYRRRLIFSVL